jgi:hypothetical protein
MCCFHSSAALASGLMYLMLFLFILLMQSTIQRPWTSTVVAREVSCVFNWLGGELTAVAEEGWAVGAVDVEHVGVAWGCDAEVGLRLLVSEEIL